MLHSSELLPLQLWITTVLALGWLRYALFPVGTSAHIASYISSTGMIETTLLFLHYLTWNDYGNPSIFVSSLAMIFGVTKRACSRVVVLMVSLGYGVVRPSLGDEMDKILYLGAAYFLLSLVRSSL